MIYAALKSTLLTLLQAPKNPPEPPAGSPGSVRTFRAAKNFLRIRLLLLASGLLVALAFEAPFILVLFTEGLSAESALLIVLLVMTLLGFFFSYFLIRLDYDMRYYIVTDRSIRIRQGAWTIHEATFTFANIQNLSLKKGPIERLFGISNLVVHTAGGGGSGTNSEKQGPLAHRSTLRGIDNAEELKNDIMRLLKQYRDAGLGDPEDRHKASVAPARSQSGPALVSTLTEIRDELQAWRASL